MIRSRRGRLALGAISAVAVLTVSSCSLVPSVGGACTAMGDAEGVSADVTSPAIVPGASYLVEVCLPDLDACGSRGVTADGQRWAGASVDADLTADPVTVVVTVRDATGDVVLEKSTSAAPRLYQPNGARCDGENFRVHLGLDTDAHLVPRPLP